MMAKNMMQNAVCGVRQNDATNNIPRHTNDATRRAATNGWKGFLRIIL
jgi:hypothetical protein